MKGFRVARAAPLYWNVGKTLAQTMVFWSVFLFALPAVLATAETRLGVPSFAFAGQRALGVVLFALCGSLGLTSGYTMAVRGQGTPLPLDTARCLVVRGPYRHLRNPMAVAGIGQGIAVGVWLGSWLVLGYALAGAVLWDRLVRPIEEKELLERFGESYARYRAAVRCWWPGP